MVGIASRGGYVPTGESDTTYVQLKAVAQARLDLEDPGLPTALYDWCHALLITHMALADETAGYASMSTGEFSRSITPGQSIFSLEYSQIIESYSSASTDSDSEEDVTRSDSLMEDFKLDQTDIPVYYIES